MTEVEKLIEIYQQLEKAGLMVTAGKKSAAELMVSHDVVPVVRCKDCKYYEWNQFDGCEVCTHISGYVRPDFGCVDGERRSDG